MIRVIKTQTVLTEFGQGFEIVAANKHMVKSGQIKDNVFCSYTINTNYCIAQDNMSNLLLITYYLTYMNFWCCYQY